MFITEALAEIKTIQKRIEKKRQFVFDHLIRQSIVVDPLMKDGGQKSAIEREQQAIQDLETRTVELRRAIADANMSNTLTVRGVAKTIDRWLTWKREVANQRRTFLDQIRGRLQSTRSEFLRKGFTITSTPEEASQMVFALNVDESKLAKDIEEMEAILGELDGALSLANATITVTEPTA